MEIGQLFNSSSNLIWEMDRRKKEPAGSHTDFPKTKQWEWNDHAVTIQDRFYTFI